MMKLNLSLWIRVVSYSLALMGVMYLAENKFIDSYAAHISLFTLFVIIFEMMWNLPGSSDIRPAVYRACVAGIAILGVSFTIQVLILHDVTYSKDLVDRRLGEVLENTYGPLICQDENGIITNLSPGFETLSGYKRKELIGHPISKVFPEKSELTALFALLTEQNSPGWIVRFTEGVLIKKDGETIKVVKQVIVIRYVAADMTRIFELVGVK